jgi:hypothetical protein
MEVKKPYTCKDILNAVGRSEFAPYQEVSNNFRSLIKIGAIRKEKIETGRVFEVDNPKYTKICNDIDWYKTYLNRNIIANNIEYGYDGSSENKEHQTETYHSVAPATPTVEVPKPNIPTLQDVAPKPVSKPDIKEPVKAPTTSFTTNIEDELPF